MAVFQPQSINLAEYDAATDGRASDYGRLHRASVRRRRLSAGRVWDEPVYKPKSPGPVHRHGTAFTSSTLGGATEGYNTAFETNTLPVNAPAALGCTHFLPGRRAAIEASDAEWTHRLSEAEWERQRGCPREDKPWAETRHGTTL